MSGVTVAGTTLVGVGAAAWPESPVADAWTSSDGTTWSRTADVGSTPGLINAVAGDGRGLVAVGLVVSDEGDPDAAVWYSGDE